MAIYSSNQNKLKKETIQKVGISLIVVFSVLFLNLLFGVIPFINSFFLGFFGLFSYPLLLSQIVLGVLFLCKKRITTTKKDIVLYVLWLFFFMSILHLATSTGLDDSYGNYLSAVYKHKYTAGGLLMGIFVYPLYSLTYALASYILYAVVLVVLTAVIIDRMITRRNLKNVTLSKAQVHQEEDVLDDNFEEVVQSTPQKPKFDDDIFVSDDYEVKNDLIEKTVRDKDKDKARKILGLSDEDEQTSNAPVPQSNKFDFLTAQKMGMDKNQYVKTPYATLDDQTIDSKNKPSIMVHDDEFDLEQNGVVDTKPAKPEMTESRKRSLDFIKATIGEYNPLESDKKSPKQEFDIYDQNFSMEEYKGNKEKYNSLDTNFNLNTDFNAQYKEEPVEEIAELSFDDIDAKEVDYKSYSAPTTRPYTMQTKVEGVKPKTFMQQVDINEISKKVEKPKKIPKPMRYVAPDLSLLRDYNTNDTIDREALALKGEQLERTLEAFKIPAKITNITVGPAFTRYELQLPLGIPVSRVNQIIANISMSLETSGKIRTEIPIPGKNAFGIEVPNAKVTTVSLRDVLASDNFLKNKSPLTYALGKDIGGECRVSTINDATHMLIAGSTGSGKSVCLNAMLISLIYKSSPEDVRIILVDPKQVEFTLYNGLPHLLIPNVITAPDKALDALSWCVDEMERRFSLFSQFKVRDMKEYNNLEEVKSRLQEKMPYLIVVVDELADLMTNNKKEIEEKINKLAAKCRAAGIHLVLATQRPSVDVITGTIKNNLPSRIAFAVSSFNDSRTILGEGGAENLLGKGDMLFAIQGKPISRIQGAFITNEEVNDIVNFVKEHNEADFDEEIEEKMFNRNNGGIGFEAEPTAEMFDPLMKEALRNVIRSNNVSASKLQRIFAIGFTRAGRIVDQMEAAGFISAKDSKNNRTIFITQQEFEEKFGEDL